MRGFKCLLGAAMMSVVGGTHGVEKRLRGGLVPAPVLEAAPPLPRAAKAKEDTKLPRLREELTASRNPHASLENAAADHSAQAKVGPVPGITPNMIGTVPGGVDMSGEVNFIPPYRVPGGESPAAQLSRKGAPRVSPGNSVDDYRAYREYMKRANSQPKERDNLIPPITTGQELLHPNLIPRHTEPFGAYGDADFVGDNMVDTVRHFGRSQAESDYMNHQGNGGGGVAFDAGNNQQAPEWGKPGSKSSPANVKTTPGSSCNSWHNCMDCVQFSFCVWNDEGQSCRQEIDVIFSSIHSKYYKTCAAGSYGERVGPSRLKETPVIFPQTAFGSMYGGGLTGVSGFAQGRAGMASWNPRVDASNTFEPPYLRRERAQAELQAGLNMGAKVGLWQTPEEHLDWSQPGAHRGVMMPIEPVPDSGLLVANVGTVDA